MKQDPFGDLQQWDHVLDQLEELRSSHMLDESQPGLARILRYRRNWRLVERVLQLARDIQQANDLLIWEVLSIVVDSNMDLENRVLAARALGSLLPRFPPTQDAVSLDLGRVEEMLEALTKKPGPPIVLKAVREVLDELGATRQ